MQPFQRPGLVYRGDSHSCERPTTVSERSRQPYLHAGSCPVPEGLLTEAQNRIKKVVTNLLQLVFATAVGLMAVERLRGYPSRPDIRRLLN